MKIKLSVVANNPDVVRTPKRGNLFLIVDNTRGLPFIAPELEDQANKTGEKELEVYSNGSVRIKEVR
jgi:hypothetical protein